jgi:hypothetical protein
MKKICMIAFHYPPLRGSSGVQRTLKFSQYLPKYGWQPMILTTHPRAYHRSGSDQIHEIPAAALVKRAFALDTVRHLSLRGSYAKWMTLPDRWISWWLGAVPAGLRLLRTHRPEVLWSTYPIATAHLIGLTLHRLTGIPWVADFRDPMTEGDYPSDPAKRTVYQWIERQTVQHCTQAVFTTPGAWRMHAARYPAILQSRWAMIANGYDEENFLEASGTLQPRSAPHQRIMLVHSGVLYPAERDPRAFFAALAALRQAGKISAAHLQIILRASGNEEHYRQLLLAHGIADMVCLAPSIPYRAALTEMLRADGLLLLQASNCNHQIPAKAYEYLRARRPILALTGPQGDTAGVLRTAGIDTIVPLDAPEQIARGLLNFLTQVRASCAPIASDQEIARHSRESRTQELVKLLDALT